MIKFTCLLLLAVLLSSFTSKESQDFRSFYKPKENPVLRADSTLTGSPLICIVAQNVAKLSSSYLGLRISISVANTSLLGHPIYL